MYNYYVTVIDKLDIKEQAATYLKEVGKRLISEHEDQIHQCIQRTIDSDFNMKEIQSVLEGLAESSGLHQYTVDWIFIAVASEQMQASFLKLGYGEAVFWATIKDLKYKLYECMDVKGVIGTFVIGWYELFLKLRIVALGRLQYEKTLYKQQAYKTKGYTVNRGDTVYSVHIPSSGPLTEGLCYQSYRLAYHFFSDELKGGPLVCICDSWLLYKRNREIFPERLNMIRFMDDWAIIHSEEEVTGKQLWRIFGVEFDGDLRRLPANNTPRKALLEWLQSGRHMGTGFGVMIYDGKRSPKMLL